MLPYIGLAIVGNMGGALADWIYSKGVSMMSVRKIMNTLGFVLPAICFLCLNALGKCDVGSDLFHSECTEFYKASALLTAGIALGGLAFSGYW